MPSTVCTLVEGDFHLGLGALVNSLVHHGYGGHVWVGHRGPLPPWARDAKDRGAYHELPLSTIHHPPSTIHDETSRVALRFVALTTTAHLTNYKSEFLLRVLEDLDPQASALFYFDPDIVVKVRWSFFEEWAGYGVALVEDVNSPLPQSHPRRFAWRRSLTTRGKAVQRETDLCINGGFIGLAREHLAFLHEWHAAMQLVEEHIGDLSKSMFNFGPDGADKHCPSYPFNKTDQDALNIAVMTSSAPVSIMGAEGMDFRPGGWTMSHALGPEKPWRKRFLTAALAGRPPTPADREYWRHVRRPISLYDSRTASLRTTALAAAAFLGRFYHRL